MFPFFPFFPPCVLVVNNVTIGSNNGFTQDNTTRTDTGNKVEQAKGFDLDATLAEQERDDEKDIRKLLQYIEKQIKSVTRVGSNSFTIAAPDGCDPALIAEAAKRIKSVQYKCCPGDGGITFVNDRHH